MSAIAGFINLDGTPADAGLLERMTAIVAHRGPDGINHWLSGPAGLGYLQLATTPESVRESQPLRFDNGTSALVWDGRLDNRTILADELGLKGMAPEPTDADLVVAGYRKWGLAVFQRMVGDFALALWDGNRQELVCARDPIGLRPFHYHYDGRRLTFGTEIKQILQDPNVPKRLDSTMLGLALCSSWGHASATFYKDIKRLPGGYWLTVSASGLRSEPFWDPDPNNAIRFPHREDYAERFREILIEAVACRLRTAGGVGINLSGGVDSSSVASIAGLLRQTGRLEHASINALSCVHDGAELDESPYVRAVTDRYDIPVSWVPVDDDWAMRVVQGPLGQDEPYHIHFEAIHHKLLRTAQEQGIRVLLTGEGGDESSMYGYMLHTRDWFIRMHWFSIWRDLRGSTPAYRHAAYAAIRRAVTPGRLREWRGQDASSIPRWVRPGFIRTSDLRPQLRSLEPRSRRGSLYVHLRGRLPLLLGGDVRAAGFGVEFRHPLWDARVVEFLSRIPPEVRFEGGKEKPLLRHAMKGILPEPVRLRRSHGAFGALVKRGLRTEERDRIRHVLSTSRLDSMGLIDSKMLLDTFEQYVAGDDAKMGRIMPTLLVEEWVRATEES